MRQAGSLLHYGVLWYSETASLETFLRLKARHNNSGGSAKIRLTHPRKFSERAASPEDSRAFAFLEINQRQEKPRTAGLTEIRGPYYTPMGRRYLEDVLETMGAHVDSLKFAGGSFSLMPRTALREIIDTAHRFDVEVSTGGFIERVLSKGAELVDRYIGECAEFGFDTIEISSGFITLPIEDWGFTGEKSPARRAESKAGSRHSIRRWRRERGVGSRSDWDRFAATGHRTRAAISLRRSQPDHD